MRGVAEAEVRIVGKEPSVVTEAVRGRYLPGMKAQSQEEEATEIRSRSRRRCMHFRSVLERSLAAYA